MERKFTLLVIFCFVLLFTSISYAGVQSPVFGTKKYLRLSGSPTIYTDVFNSCNTGASYMLVVENGDAGEYMISSASISLNGSEIVKQNEFNQNVNRIEKPISLNQDNTLDIKIASRPDAFLNISIYCTANCLDVKVLSPADQSAIDRARTIIEGSLYNTYGETGVTVKGAGINGDFTDLAQVSGTVFAGIVQLQPGINTITATVTDACGYQAQDTITVNTAKVEEPVRLTVLPSSGILSAVTGAFKVTLEAEANLANPIANYSWDLNGDGAPEMEGKDLSKITANYENIGLNLPAVTITDALGNKYTERAVVNVFSRDDMDTLLKGKWEGMRGGLVSGDIDKVISFFETNSQDTYREQFSALKPVLNSIGSEMGQITLGKIEDDSAEYELITTRNGATYSFHLLFVKDKDGLWKIKRF